MFHGLDYKKNLHISFKNFRSSDCSEWSQSILYEIRQNQLAEEQKIENELKYKEMIKQKRLELTRKFFFILKEIKTIAIFFETRF